MSFFLPFFAAILRVGSDAKSTDADEEGSDQSDMEAMDADDDEDSAEEEEEGDA